MKKARNKYSFYLILLFAFGCFESKAQIADNLTSSYLDNNFSPKDSSFSIERLRKLLSQSKFDEVRISINRNLANLSKSVKDSISELLINEHPAFNRYWQTEEVWGNETHEVLPNDTVLQLTVDNEKSHFSWFGNIAWGFVWRWGRMHKGLDSDLKTGDTVRASFNGIVRYSSFFWSRNSLWTLQFFNCSIRTISYGGRAYWFRWIYRPQHWASSSLRNPIIQFSV
jgi:hypothetical protein